jgi:hypothetical protein
MYSRAWVWMRRGSDKAKRVGFGVIEFEFEMIGVKKYGSGGVCEV